MSVSSLASPPLHPPPAPPPYTNSQVLRLRNVPGGDATQVDLTGVSTISHIRIHTYVGMPHKWI